ncbi:MAG: histidine phosphatase family protein [Actinomycetota bacterium]
MAALWYVSHPEVRIDGDVPVPRWGLTDTGRARATTMCEQPWIGDIERIVSSDETKALELAAIVGVHCGLPVEVRPETAETDRTSTGYVPREEHDALAAAWFAAPESSPSGWEPAAVVQARVVAALADLLDGDASTMIAGHGGAGTLWWCHLMGAPIEATRDQPFAGHYFTVDVTTRRPLHGWRRVDDLESASGRAARR